VLRSLWHTACEERWREVNFFNLVKRRGKAMLQSCNNGSVTGRAVTKGREPNSSQWFQAT